MAANELMATPVKYLLSKIATAAMLVAAFLLLPVNSALIAQEAITGEAITGGGGHF